MNLFYMNIVKFSGVILSCIMIIIISSLFQVVGIYRFSNLYSINTCHLKCLLSLRNHFVFILMIEEFIIRSFKLALSG